MKKILKKTQGIKSPCDMKTLIFVFLTGVFLAYSICSVDAESTDPDTRTRARDIGIQIGTIPNWSHTMLSPMSAV